MSLFRRNVLPDRQEAAIQKTVSHLRAQRRNRFRILACIDGTDESFISVRKAARFGASDECDIIILYVRPIDTGLHSGGLQVRLARQNMMESGFELPGVSHLKRALDILKAEGLDVSDWSREVQNQDAWGDPAGDNKIEYKGPTGRSVVLKLKTAPDVAVGILDQYELGPYNLIIVGAPSRWRSEFRSLFDSGVVQTIATMAPCSVMVARKQNERMGFLFAIDGTARSMQLVRRGAVLAHVMQRDISLLSVAPDEAARPAAQEAVANAQALLKAMGITTLEARVAVGDVATSIVEVGNNYGTIVVNDERRTKMERLLRGSVATEVVRRAATSVLEVR
ncbi:universal stress protein [Aestuariivirga litoralis]|uniref:universal stress protein n=1 Tax=Aestuariivirga litoralis TaxID=2650924 RepID=UPI0018C5C6A4|nr:universal stress protein [Aestuariivirga litoralis]MBG1232283.1 universal stress protein [Aestuariivirga litoralis]